MTLPSHVDSKEWISDEEVADPAELPVIHGWNILLRPVNVRKKTKGGLILPESTREDIKYLNSVARVLAIGPLAYGEKDKFTTGPWVKVGDFVVIPRFAGQRFIYRGVKMIIVDDQNILMTIKDPSDIDAAQNLLNSN
jgi:co-chaperonin GroES (HSP10)